jgi:hypothetical protein
MPKGYFEHPNRHGMFGTRVYNIWGRMIQRCRNPKDRSYHRYGGRGIEVCPRWLDFKAFYEDMGDPPPRHSLERINNAKGYTPENCRWATSQEQCRNTRRNLHITLNGVTKTAVEWAEELGINSKTLYTRKASGWSDERALTQPIRRVTAAS